MVGRNEGGTTREEGEGVGNEMRVRIIRKDLPSLHVIPTRSANNTGRSNLRTSATKNHQIILLKKVWRVSFPEGFLSKKYPRALKVD